MKVGYFLACEEFATWAVEVQREHVETVRRASLKLAVQEIAESADG